MLKLGTLLKGRYKLGKRLGGGSFGEVYLGIEFNFNWIVIDTEKKRKAAAKLVQQIRFRIISHLLIGIS